MSDALYEITYRASLPPHVRVGDMIRFSGTGTVKSIDADLVNVTQLGDEGDQFVLGEVTVVLIANQGETESKTA